ncbi:MAG: helicase-exonuclease AddAB subunit AddA [Oscillospiraceae bacterium]|nr:helicase-exonuclease AddAB subunit AddA [Oscillospiraceae bacterium]
MAWTPQQEAAINDNNGGLIVSAAAGSGKTSVLVERLTRIISDRENPVPVEKMIVVTFTVDAAAEMRQRLSVSLEKAIAQEPDDMWLRRQQMLLPGANISTINAFCFNLIREHIGDGEITSSFKVLDDSEHDVLISRAADEAIKLWHREKPEDMAVLWNAFCNKSDAPLEEVLGELHRFFGSIPFRSVWIKNALAEYEKPSWCNKYFQNFYKSLRSETAAIRKMCDRAVYLAADLYDSNNNILEWVTMDYDAVSMLDKLLNEKDLDPEKINDFAINAMGIHSGHSYPPMRKKDILDSVRFDEVRNLRLQYSKRISDILGRITSMLPYFESDMNEHLKILPLLCDLEKDMSDILWKMKAEKNSLSFDDGERLALELLSETDDDGNVRPSAAAKELSEYYELIMIDECQDSNNKQDYIFRLISRGGYDEKTGRLRYGSNVFMVGDVKQCIYQFRNANPGNFSIAAGEAVPYSENSDAPLKLIRLSKNFRSSSQVVSFVNFLFSELMTEKCGEVSYTEDEWLYMGADRYKSLSYENQATEVVILPENKELEEDISAEYTAETISRMLAEGYPVMEKDGSVRPCRYEDFCILLRNNKPAKLYAKALEKKRIPVRGAEETGYLRSKEISLILNLLRVLDNPLLETPLAAVMLSPMFSFTADDVAKIRLANKKLSLYASMCVMLEKNAGDEELLKKCRNLYDVISSFRTESALYSLEELIRRIYETTDFMSVMQLYQDGGRKKANLHLLLMYVRSYEENSHGGISGFLRYVDIMTESGKDFAQAGAADSSDQAVQIKTMHGSKGLEFPFVFVCRTETEFSAQDNMKKLVCTDSAMAGFRLKNPDTLEKYQSLPHMIIQEEKKKQQLSEELRLLYVALTRARQKLFIPLVYGEKEKKKTAFFAELLRNTDRIPDSLVSGANSMSDWLWMSLIHRGDEKLREFVPETAGTDRKERTFEELQINYTNDYIASVSEIQQEKPLPSASLQTLRSIREHINFEYSSDEQGQISLISVSAVSKADSSESLTLKRPRCIRSEKKRLTGAEHGTAVHSFFQYAVFSRAECDPMGELKKLWQSGFITEEQMKTVSFREIEPFFRSSIYSRIKKSPLLYREKKFLIRVSDLDIPENIEAEDLKPLLSYRNSGSMMKGIIDLAFLENDEFVLLDYKTDASACEEELKEKYRMQLYIYSLALKQITGKNVKECLIYSTHFSSEIKVEF